MNFRLFFFLEKFENFWVSEVEKSKHFFFNFWDSQNFSQLFSLICSQSSFKEIKNIYFSIYSGSKMLLYKSNMIGKVYEEHVYLLKVISFVKKMFVDIYWI